MPCAKLNSSAIVTKVMPTASSQCVRGSLRRARVAITTTTAPTTAAQSSQPAWPPSAKLNSRKIPVPPPNVVEAPPPNAAGPPACPVTRPKPS